MARSPIPYLAHFTVAQEGAWDKEGKPRWRRTASSSKGGPTGSVCMEHTALLSSPSPHRGCMEAKGSAARAEK